MKKNYRLGTVIAEREILFQVGKKKSKVHIKIGKPKLYPDPDFPWYCITNYRHWFRKSSCGV